MAVIRIPRLLRLMEAAQSREKLVEILHSQDSQDVAIELIASENKIPKFLAKNIYLIGLKKFQEKLDPQDRSMYQAG